MSALRELWPLVKAAVNGWMDDRAASMGAALAYYTVFSLAPLLIIVITVAGLIFGRDAAQEAIVTQLGGLVGETGGDAINSILESNSDFGSGVVGLIVGIAALLLGATTAFVELQDDLDRIWKAEPRVGSGILNFIRSRLLSFGMILFIGFLLTVSLALSAGLAAIGNAMFASMEILLHVANFAVSFLVITALFAMIYKVLPNAKTEWRDVWVGAAITALLFEIGKYLIGLYIGKSSVATSFGAAGPFVVIVLWIYYSTQIFLLGAEFTVKYSERRHPHEKKDAAKSGATPEISSGTGRKGLPTAAAANEPAASVEDFPPPVEYPSNAPVPAWVTTAATLLVVGGAAVSAFTDLKSSRKLT
jgi:membrane protein